MGEFSVSSNLSRAVFSAAALLLSSTTAHALSVSPSLSADELVNTLFLGQSGVTVTGATLSFGDGSAPDLSNSGAGTYTNAIGTYGLPGPGVVFSSGAVANYGAGPNTDDSFSGGSNRTATSAQNDLLDDLTGQSSHFDPVQLTINFDVSADVDGVSFIGAFGSEEFPDFVGSSFTDGFGLFVNGTNVAGVQQSGAAPGDPLLPVNIDHPDFAAIAGTELNGVLAPNGVPVLLFEAPIEPGSTGNTFDIIIADASDTILDTTVYLSSFGDFDANDGSSEFTPILPSNPPDPETGAFIFELPEIEPDVTFWIDPPVSVGYEYEITGAEFAMITAPSLATVNDPDGYLITFAGGSATLLPSQSFTLPAGITSFVLSGIDPSLMLDPANATAFPLGIMFANITAGTPTLSQTPIVSNPIPLPATAFLSLAALGALGFAGRRRQAT